MMKLNLMNNFLCYVKKIPVLDFIQKQKGISIFPQK